MYKRILFSGVLLFLVGRSILAHGSEYQEDSVIHPFAARIFFPEWEAPCYPINSFLLLGDFLNVTSASDTSKVLESQMRLLTQAVELGLLDTTVWSLVQRWHWQMLNGHVARVEYDFKKALLFYDKALEISREIEDARYKINALYACHEMEEANENLVLALEFFKEYVRVVHNMQDSSYAEAGENVVQESNEQTAYSDNLVQKTVVLGVFVLLIIFALYYLSGTLGYHISISRNSRVGSEVALDQEVTQQMFVNIYKPGVAITEEQVDEEILVDDDKIDLLVRLREIKLTTKDEWERFQYFFDRVHFGYLVKLRLKHFGLTPTEEKLCCLIRLHFATREIAKTFGISNHSVNVARYRLRKKVLPAGNLTLEEYLMTI